MLYVIPPKEKDKAMTDSTSNRSDGKLFWLYSRFSSEAQIGNDSMRIFNSDDEAA
jgi:hypothetical protein